MKKISIIVPIYNVEKYLAECLESIIKQTYLNLEIILVNDGSVDNSLKIAEEFAVKDNRIKLYTKENGGLSDARNYGLTVASGDYIGFVDSDDKVFPTMFETLINLLESNKADIAMVDFIRSNETLKNDEITVKTYGKEVFKEIMLDKISSHVWDKLFKKELFANISFPKGLHFEDLAIFYQIAYKIDKFVLSNEKLYWYRIDNVNSITFKKDNSDFNARCISWIYREKTAFAYRENLTYKDEVLKMSVKYNTDFYRVFKNQNQYRDDLHNIKSYIRVYYKDIMFNRKIDPLKKFFCFMIKHNLF